MPVMHQIDGIATTSSSSSLLSGQAIIQMSQFKSSSILNIRTLFKICNRFGLLFGPLVKPQLYLLWNARFAQDHCVAGHPKGGEWSYTEELHVECFESAS